MNRIIIIVATMLTNSGAFCAHLDSTDSPIDGLGTRLAADHLWRNGLFPMIDLPESATPHDVLTEFFAKTSFGEGRVTFFTVHKTKTVTIRGSLPDTYTAVLIDSNLGQKIVLLQYAADQRWWTKIYDVKAMPNKPLQGTPQKAQRP